MQLNNTRERYSHILHVYGTLTVTSPTCMQNLRLPCAKVRAKRYALWI